MTDTRKSEQQRRLEWFRAARYGMFIHWGLYSQIGRHEWVMNRERMPIEEYEKLAQTWQPEPDFAAKWAKLARKSGMRYMVLTAKHHEGYCLFKTEHTDYNSVDRGPGRDLVAEYVEAARAEGLRVGLYYSLNDWHHPDAAASHKDEGARRRFVDFTHGLVRELCSNYGKIDLLWYDCPYPLMTAEAWESEKLNAMARELQPDIIINNRSRLPEDFGTPEQHITPEAEGRMWEACMTLNGSWGYTPIDKDYKSARAVVAMLRQVASGGGNLLLNMGPPPDGSILKVYRKVFGKVGQWLERCGESVYDAADPVDEMDWQITGTWTRKGSAVYFHCRCWPGTELVIGGLKNRVLSVRMLGGDEVAFEQSADRLVLKGLPEKAPSKLATVFRIDVEGKPVQKLGVLMTAEA